MNHHFSDTNDLLRPFTTIENNYLTFPSSLQSTIHVLSCCISSFKNLFVLDNAAMVCGPQKVRIFGNRSDGQCSCIQRSAFDSPSIPLVAILFLNRCCVEDFVARCSLGIRFVTEWKSADGKDRGLGDVLLRLEGRVSSTAAVRRETFPQMKAGSIVILGFLYHLRKCSLKARS